MAALPTGTVTFLFTDIEGSTKIVQKLGDGWREVLEQHNRLIRKAIRDLDGIDLSTEGDSFFAVFGDASAAVSAAVAAQRAVGAEIWPGVAPVRVRMGLHTGRGVRGGEGYVGLDVHRAARIAAAGHGGQVLLSGATRGLVEYDLPDGVTIRELGSHRLKDIEHPEALHQLVIPGLPADFPPVRAHGERRSNLPGDRTSFVGREQEVAEIIALLSDTRLLTLTGPGGTGKTRLALQVAADQQDRFADGVFWADLSDISDHGLVPSVISAALGVREVSGQAILESVVSYLRERNVLLVLDNFEQVTEAASAVDVLLAASEGLRVLTTSRNPLHLGGEQEYPVPPLALPDPRGRPGPEAMARYEAVALFVQRATAVRPDFELTAANAFTVGEICARVDGLPLAIELAASRIKVLNPRALLARLDCRLPLLTGGSTDRPERHRTLRAAIDWSHDLLDSSERSLLARLAVFAGGWTLDSADRVCGPRLGGAEEGQDRADILEALSSLVDRSLVQRIERTDDEVRFGMLETIREFAAERLAYSGEEEEIRRRHAEHFRDITEEAESHLTGDSQAQWLRRLDLEHDNVRAALRWCEKSGDVDTAIRTAAGVWRFWQRQGHLAEGRATVERLLEMPGSARDALRARGLATLGNMAYWQNDYNEMAAAYKESLEIASEIGDPSLIAHGIRNVSFIPLVTGDMDRAEELKREALAAAAMAGDSALVAEAQQSIGIIQLLRGNPGAAIAPIEEAIARHREAGDRILVAEALLGLAAAKHATGDAEGTRALVRESLRLQAEAGNATGLVVGLVLEAAVASADGRHRQAARLMGAWARLQEEQGGGPPPFLLALFGDPDGAARMALGDDVYKLARAEGYAMDLTQAVALAMEDAD